MYLIEEIVSVKSGGLDLRFNNGEVRHVNLRPMFKKLSTTQESLYRQLLDEEVFKKVRLNSEMKSIEWPNGVDLCPDQLYNWSEKTTNYGA